METNINYTVVGGFVLILSAAIVLAVIWLSAGLSMESYSTYKVYMKESVSGLTIDSAVEFNGVSIGTVSSIEISKRDPQLVELLLKIKSSTPVSQGTRAMLNSRGLTGITYIALQDKGADRRPLRILPGEVYAVINTSPSLYMRIDTALGQFSENFRRISLAIESLLNKENLQLFKGILQNTEIVTKQFIPLMQTSMDTLNVMNTQTLPLTNQTISTIGTLSHQLQLLTDELKANPSMILRGKAAPALGPGEQ